MEFLKYIKLLFIFIFCMSLSVSATENMDTLWIDWNNPNLSDITRLEALESYINESFLYTQPEKAFELAKIEYDFASKKGLEQYMGSALKIKGVAQYFLGDFQTALDFFKQALVIFEKLKLPEQISNILNNHGIAYFELGDYDNAIDYHTQSLVIRDKLGDKKMIAQSLNNIGTIYHRKADYPKAIEYYTRSADIKAKIGLFKSHSITLTNLGMIYTALGDYSKSLEYLQRALSIDEKLNNKVMQSASLSYIGTIYTHQGNYAKAIEYLTRSLALSEEIKNKKVMSLTLSRVGDIYVQQENYEDALGYYFRSLRLLEEMDRSGEIATSLNNIGTVYQKQADAAIESGNTEQAITKYASAIDYLERSLAINEEKGYKSRTVDNFINLGKVHSRLGDSETALVYFNRSLSIAEAISYKIGITKSANNIGTVYKNRGDSALAKGETSLASTQYNKAIESIEDALLLAKELGEAIEVKKATKSLYELYKIAEQYMQALAMFERYLETKSDIENEQNQREVIRQKYKYEYEKKAIADSIRTAEKEKLQTALLNESKTRQLFLILILVLLVGFIAIIYNRFLVTNNQKLIIAESYKKLKLAQASLVQSEKMASLGQLVAGIAHEINTPLGIGVTGASLIKDDIKSLSDAFRDGELTEEKFDESLSSITESSSVVLSNLKRAAGLIRSFKQISGDQHLEEKRKFQICEYISSIIETMSPRLKKGGGSMSLTCDPELSIFGAPGYLYQIFSNLIVNSIDHGFDGKSKGEITLDIQQIDRSIVFIYRDNGKGMSKEEIKKVFDPFFTTKRGSGNSGLGMHIVYNLVNQKLGGEISCRRSPGSGIEFKIVLPTDYEES